jgi:hypothetical protein
MTGMVKMLSLPPGEEDAFMAAHDPAGMSVREIERAVKEWKGQEATFGEKADAAFEDRLAALNAEKDQIIAEMRREAQEKDESLALLTEQYREVFQMKLDEAAARKAAEARIEKLEAVIALSDESYGRESEARLDEMSRAAREEAFEAAAHTAEDLSRSVGDFIARNAWAGISSAGMRRGEKIACREALGMLKEWIDRADAALAVEEAEAVVA